MANICAMKRFFVLISLAMTLVLMSGCSKELGFGGIFDSSAGPNDMEVPPEIEGGDK